MTRDWESTFRNWASPPGKTEQERCKNTERTIKNAIAASPQLNKRNIEVFTQGSYRNNTNVRQDSDVDIGILCYDTFLMELPQGYTRENFNINPATYSYAQFKNEVGQALVDYFGSAAVSRGNKAFDIKENSYHVDADVAPFFEHRRYSTNGTYLSGVELIPDNGGTIINWPEQHYNNGVSKNSSTYRRYKAMVRILKKLCNEMADNGVSIAGTIPGFLNECLVWNVPNNLFGNNSYINDVRGCLAHLFNNTMSDEKCSEWGEVSELKYLFRLAQKWTRQQTHSFISVAWDYIGFK
jgi:hypothetical protein